MGDTSSMETPMMETSSPVMETSSTMATGSGCLTMEGYECVFPFVHMNQVFFHCTNTDEVNGFQWCGLDAEGNRQQCNMDTCMGYLEKCVAVKTEDADVCAAFDGMEPCNSFNKQLGMPGPCVWKHVNWDDHLMSTELKTSSTMAPAMKCVGELAHFNMRCEGIDNKEDCEKMGKNPFSDGICDWVEDYPMMETSTTMMEMETSSPMTETSSTMA